MRLLPLLAVLLAVAATAQPVVLDGAGQPSTLSAIVAASAEADVLFLGEQHDDSTGHAVQLEILDRLLAGDRPVVLALEMVETDAQTVLDEYLAGLARERDWLAAGRPWGNYEADYRPMVEAMRQAGRPVVASNAPGRYVTLVSRRAGLAVLDSLAADARAWLPPTIDPPSEALTTKFTDLMGGMPHGSGPTVEGMLTGQNLRDATMAWRIAEALVAHPGALVVHLNGSFHSAGGLGIPEHLARLAPDAETVIVTMAPDAEAPVPGEDFSVRTAW